MPHPIDREDWPLLEAENQAEMFAYLGTASCATSHVSAAVTWVVTGVDSNDYNGIVQARMTAAEADGIVPALVQQFREQQLPALWHIDLATQPADLAQRLDRLGCTRLAPGVCMAAELARVALVAPSVAGLSVTPVADAADLAAWIDVWVAGDDEPRQPRERLYAALGLDAQQPLRHYLARLDGQPVGVAQVFLGQRAAGLYSVAVLPSFRRRGIGTALTLVAFSAARAAGYAIGVLGPSPEGQPMYRRLGFELFPSPFVGYALWLET